MTILVEVEVEVQVEVEVEVEVDHFSSTFLDQASLLSSMYYGLLDLELGGASVIWSWKSGYRSEMKEMIIGARVSRCAQDTAPG